MINVLKKYIKMGIDAIRVDHALGASLNYLKRMTDEIHKEYPNIPFIGEVPPCTLIKFAETIKSISKEKLLLVEKEDLNSIPYVDQIFLDFEGYLNGLLDFNFKNIVKAFCEGEIDYDICIKMLNEHYDKFKGKNIFLVKFLDSHDENRLLFTCNNDKKLMMKALTILFTKFEGRNDPLIIYYGTEDFMSQSKTIYNEDYGDFRTRQPMNFIFEKMKDLLNN
jgi:glycosidase